jgi:RimJ/RimL family protein N-acetyltransferase
MIEVPAGSIPKVADLFAGLGHHLAVRAVLQGAAAGRLFVDRRENPSAALIWVQHRVFLGGPPTGSEQTAALRNLLARKIAAEACDRGDYAFGLYYAPPWHDRLSGLLPSLPFRAIDRQYFAADRPGQLQPRLDLLPAGLRLAPVDAALLARTELSNYDRLAEECCSERASVADFLARSFGVCVLDGNILAGWCLSEYNCGERCEVGIETVEPYQRRGLGALMAQALCAEADRHGIRQVGWHCLAQNAASAATARKAGLQLVLEYPSAVVWLRA